MLFITNRFPRGSIQSKEGRVFDFDLKNNAPSNSVFYCERDDSNGDIHEIGSNNLLKKLKTSKYRQILIYIHGYSNLPNDVFSAADEFQSLCNINNENEVLVLPIIWPCDNDMGIVKDYWDDQKSADGSALSLSRALNKFIDWRKGNELSDDHCLKRINVLAHSMGNRVLRETLFSWNKYDLSNGVPLLFRNTFLIAADIENESIHRNERAQYICHASRNVIIYFASDDLALRSSKIANLKNNIASRRLGHTGPENMSLTPNNVYVVDCDDVNTKYDPPKGHSYFRSGDKKGVPGKVFEHIYSCLKTGRVLSNDEEKRMTIIRD